MNRRSEEQFFVKFKKKTVTLYMLVKVVCIDGVWEGSECHICSKNLVRIEGIQQCCFGVKLGIVVFHRF